MRMDVGSRTSNCSGRSGTRAVSVMSMAPATFSAGKKKNKRRKGRRATQGGNQHLDDRVHHGAECSSVHVNERKGETLALRVAMEDMRAIVQGGAASDAGRNTFYSLGDDPLGVAG